jgi:hypothetical protein
MSTNVYLNRYQNKYRFEINLGNSPCILVRMLTCYSYKINISIKKTLVLFISFQWPYCAACYEITLAPEFDAPKHFKNMADQSFLSGALGPPLPLGLS